MVVRHHVRDHRRSGYHVDDYMRGRGRKTRSTGRYSSPGRLTSGERQRLPDSDFAVILSDGTRKYPIYNETHARNALARVDRFGNPEEKAIVRRAVARRFPGIHQEHDPPKRFGRIRGRVSRFREERRAERNIRAAVRAEEVAKANEESKRRRLERITQQEERRAREGGFFTRGFRRVSTFGRSEARYHGGRGYSGLRSRYFRATRGKDYKS